jgi:outer membrane protein
MKNNYSIIIQTLLAIAVSILFYLHFSSKNDAAVIEPTANTKDTSEIPIVIPPQSIRESKIVYINSDKLNENYDYVKDLTNAATAKQARLEATYKTKAQKLQQDYEELQQKAEAGLLSENQRNTAQEEMMKRKSELDQMEEQLQILMEEIQQSNEQVRKNVIDYLKEYNKKSNYNYILTYTDGPGGIVLLANDSLDITNEILAGLNAQYKAQKKK